MDPRSTTPAQRPHSAPPPRSGVDTTAARQREAALSLVRGEIDSIYNKNAQHPTTAVSQAAPQHPHPTLSNKETHSSNASNTAAEQWKKYHSAWQDYYQKYYEQYYMKEVRKSLAQTATSKQSATAPLGSSIDTNPQQPKKDGTVTKDEALFGLRQSIISKAQASATKVRRSRHFVPIMAATVVLVGVGLLQYNQLLIANVKAYMSPGAIAAQNIIVDPNADVPVGPEPRMIIPKINVDAPTVYNVGPSNEEQLKAMAKGIAHVKYPGATAMPGQVGNAVYSGHSSSDWTDSGAYKFVFVQLERLTVDDVIYINHDSKRYAYKVFETKVVEPTDIASLYYTGDEPIITLITCTPLGTADKRFLVFARQVSPDPSGAARADASAAPANSQAMTGTAPTLLERMFGS